MVQFIKKELRSAAWGLVGAAAVGTLLFRIWDGRFTLIGVELAGVGIGCSLMFRSVRFLLTR